MPDGLSWSPGNVVYAVEQLHILHFTTAQFMLPDAQIVCMNNNARKSEND